MKMGVFLMRVDFESKKVMGQTVSNPRTEAILKFPLPRVLSAGSADWAVSGRGRDRNRDPQHLAAVPPWRVPVAVYLHAQFTLPCGLP